MSDVEDKIKDVKVDTVPGSTQVVVTLETVTGYEVMGMSTGLDFDSAVERATAKAVRSLEKMEDYLEHTRCG